MAQSTTKKEIELVIKGIDELKKTQESFDKLLVTIKKVNTELEEMSKIKLTNVTKEFNKLNKAVYDTNTNVKQVNANLRKTASMNVKNKTVVELNKDVKHTQIDSKALNKELQKVKNTNVNNGSAKKLASDTEKATKAEKELGKATQNTTNQMKKQTGTTRLLSDSMLSLQTNATILAVGTTSLISAFGAVDSVVRELSYQFTSGAESANTMSVGLSDLAESGIFTAEQLAQLNTVTALTSFSLKDTADALLDLSKSGFDAAEAVGILTTSMMIADMENANLQATTHALVGTMNAFGMELATSETAVEDFNAAANQMVLAADLTANSVSDLTYGMRYMAPVANVLNMTFEETVALVATLGEAGLEASKGARTLASGLVRLIKPTEEVAAEMDKLNISLFTASGAFVGIVPLVQQMEEAFKGMTAEQQAMSMATLFGVEAIKSWNAVLAYGSENLQILITELEKCGDSATYMAEKFLQVSLGLDSQGLAEYTAELANLNTQAEKVTYTLETMASNNPAKFLEVMTEEVKKLALAFGEDLTKVVADLVVKWLPEIKQLFSDIDQAITDLAETLGIIEPGENFDTSALAAQAIVFTIIAGAVTLLVGAVKNFIIPGFKFVLIWKLLVAMLDLLKDLGITFEQLAKSIFLLTAAFLSFKLVKGVARGLEIILNNIYRGIDLFGKSTHDLTKNQHAKNKSIWARFFSDIGKLTKTSFGKLNKHFGLEYTLLGAATGKFMGIVNKIFGNGFSGVVKIAGEGFKKLTGTSVKGLLVAFVPFLKWGVALNTACKIIFEDFDGIVKESLERLEGNFVGLTNFISDVKSNGWAAAWANATEVVQDEAWNMENEDGFLDIAENVALMCTTVQNLANKEWAAAWESFSSIVANNFGEILSGAQRFVTELSNILAEGLGWLQDKMGWGETKTGGATGSANPNPDADAFGQSTLSTLTANATMMVDGMVSMLSPTPVLSTGTGDYYSSDFNGNSNYDQSTNSIVNNNNNSSMVVNYYAQEQNVSSEFTNMIKKLRGEQ